MATAGRERLVVGGLLVALGAGAVWATFGVRLDPDGGWGARIFPLAGAAALIGCGAVELLSRPTRAEPTGGGSGADAFGAGRVLALMTVAVGYALLMGKVGYLVSTAVAAPLALWLFGVRSRLGLALAALLCPAIYHGIFFIGLGAFPPYGEWFDLLDVIEGG